MCGQEDSLPGKEGGGSNPVTDQDFRYRLRVRSQRRDEGVSGECRVAEAMREETDWKVVVDGIEQCSSQKGRGLETRLQLS